MASRTLQVRGASLSYEMRGSGPVLLSVHGGFEGHAETFAATLHRVLTG